MSSSLSSPSSPSPGTPAAAQGGPSARKALLRQYKDAPPPVGVFAIRNVVSGRVYVGGSMNVHGAMNRARFELQQRGHRNAPLQRDWLALGPDAFTFEILQMVRHRDEPGFDARAELDVLLELWREECGFHSALGYAAGSQGEEASA